MLRAFNLHDNLDHKCHRAARAIVQQIGKKLENGKKSEKKLKTAIMHSFFLMIVEIFAKN